MLLSQGKTCFYGKTSEVATFFQSVGHTCPPGDNVADFLLDVTTVDLRNEASRVSTEATVNVLQAAYAVSGYAKAAASNSKVYMDLFQSSGADKDANLESKWNLSWIGEFSTLLSRAFLSVTREPRTTKVAVMQAVVMGVVCGSVFFGIDHTQQGIRDMQGVLFFCTLNNAFMALSAVVILFHEDKQVFNRERSAGAYRVSSYFMAKTSAELPLTLIPICIYTLICYWMIGLKNDADAFFKTLAVLALLVLTAQSFGMFISASAPSLKAAQIMAPISTVILMLFGGFYVGVDSLWDGWIWLEAISFMQYCYVALVQVQFRDTTWECDSKSYCLETGDQVIEELGFDGEERTYWAEMGKLFALLVLFRFLAYLSLRFCYRQKLYLD